MSYNAYQMCQFEKPRFSDIRGKAFLLIQPLFQRWACQFITIIDKGLL